MNENKKKYHLAKINIEKTYKNIIQKQDFYNERYADNWIDKTPYKIMAQLIKKHYKIKKVVDISCGLGYTVKYLREMGIEAFGTEFSNAFINHAPKKIKKFINQSNIVNLPFKNNTFDLVLNMEVLEHIPLSLIDQSIKELKRISNKYFIISIPSFGPNELGYSGIEINEKEWLIDAIKNIPFKYVVVDENKIPHHGHITLATYKWWTEKFLEHGLMRLPSLEKKIFNDKTLDLKRFNWNIYFLTKIEDNMIIMGKNDYLQLYTGWHKLETWNNFCIRWTKENATCFLKSKNNKKLIIDLFSGSRHLLYNRKIQIIVEKDNKILLNKKVIIKLDRWEKLIFDLKTKKGDILKITILSKTWCPKYLEHTTDERNLGIAVKEIKLE